MRKYGILLKRRAYSRNVYLIPIKAHRLEFLFISLQSEARICFRRTEIQTAVTLLACYEVVRFLLVFCFIQVHTVTCVSIFMHSITHFYLKNSTCMLHRLIHYFDFWKFSNQFSFFSKHIR